MKRRRFIKTTGAAGLFSFISPRSVTEFFEPASSSLLEENFVHPPSSALSQTIWFWMNGNVTKEGITLDLEAMKRVGIGGVLNFDVGTGIPKGSVKYLGTEWVELKKHAIRECERLGLEFIMHNCPGWSSSGGPWITPKLSMQQITSSETYVAGGRQITIDLPKPSNRLNHYEDIGVIAFPSLEGEELLQTVKVLTKDGNVDKTFMTGKDPKGALVSPVNDHAWLLFEFDQPYEARLITFFISAIDSETKNKPIEFGQPTSIVLESSDDGINFKTVTRINTGVDTELALHDKHIVFDIPVTKAKYFRLSSTKSRRYKQVQFSGIIRLKNWFEKTNQRARSYMFVAEASTIEINNDQEVPSGSIIDLNNIVDISKFMDKEGRLNWNSPAGNWTILRVGYTAMGTLNRSAPDAGVGLECDKYNPAAISFHFRKMMETLLETIKPLAAKKKIGLEIDSYEAGSQSWTAGFQHKFRKKWNYDIFKFLPALATGRVIDNVEKTERFLWDVRRLQADMIAENYYGRFSELCHQHGIRTYIEPYDMGPFEEMQIGSKADVNLGEFWNGISTLFPAKTLVIRTPKLASSIAHINNQKIVGAEAFTAEPASSRWQEYPFALKALGDKMFTKGINKLFIHRYAHQPHASAAPGMTMGPWGIHFDRGNTWWNQGKAWLTYLGRCQYLLQEGRFVADLLYFSGEDANMYTRVTRDQLYPIPPSGYDYDLVNAEAIFKKIRIVNNRIVLDNGTEYRILVLQNFKTITLPLLRRLKKLVEEGMVLVGEKPGRSAGLSYLNNENELKTIVEELWNEKSGNRENKIGRGKIFWGTDLSSILKQLHIEPDLDYKSSSGDQTVLHIHRKISNSDVYFLSNQRRSYEELQCKFRVKNKQPEFWDAVTGNRIKASVYKFDGDRVIVPVQLEPYGSVFVVFRDNPSSPHLYSVEKDNRIILGDVNTSMKKVATPLVASFTISFWAKPEINILLDPVLNSGLIKQPWTDYYAIHPVAGNKLFGDGHAAFGLTVGRNGIAVWENENGNPVLVLPVAVAVAGWSHVAIKYEDNTPSVFINGILIGKGTKSKNVVHFIYPTGEAEMISFYNGDIGPLGFFSKALLDADITKLAEESPQMEAYSFGIKMTCTNKPGFLFGSNGEYHLKYNNGKTSSFVVSNIDGPFELKGTWEVKFPVGLGGPEKIILSDLFSLHKHPDDRVKYFSGSAVYSKTFNFSKSPAVDKRFFIDLGQVEVIAEVKLNGKNLGVIWKRPYQIDVTKALKDGENKLEIEVTNLWPNRLIGDEQLPDPDKFTAGGNASGREGLIGGNIEKLPDWYVNGKPKPSNGRVAFTTWKHYTKHSPLLESGLIGPVLLSEAVVKMI